MTEIMTIEEYRAAVAKPKRANKFGAKKTVFDGHHLRQPTRGGGLPRSEAA
ncbi:hypothetical protein ACVITL_006845 [Rhizobium pisi]